VCIPRRETGTLKLSAERRDSKKKSKKAEISKRRITEKGNGNLK